MRPIRELEVRFKIDADYVEQLRQSLGIENTRELLAQSLSLLKWAVQEIEDGHVILSVNPDGSDSRRLVMPVLSRLQSRVKSA